LLFFAEKYILNRFTKMKKQFNLATALVGISSIASAQLISTGTSATTPY
jgi:hypothetical protein